VLLSGAVRSALLGESNACFWLGLLVASNAAAAMGIILVLLATGVAVDAAGAGLARGDALCAPHTGLADGLLPLAGDLLPAFAPEPTLPVLVGVAYPRAIATGVLGALCPAGVDVAAWLAGDWSFLKLGTAGFLAGEPDSSPTERACLPGDDENETDRHDVRPRSAVPGVIALGRGTFD
jgi:hypothetical protein